MQTLQACVKMSIISVSTEYLRCEVFWCWVIPHSCSSVCEIFLSQFVFDCLILATGSDRFKVKLVWTSDNRFKRCSISLHNSYLASRGNAKDVHLVTSVAYISNWACLRLDVKDITPFPNFLVFLEDVYGRNNIVLHHMYYHIVVTHALLASISDR